MRFLVLLLLLPFSLFALIRECSSIQETLEEAAPDTLLIFDLDNTLYRTKQMLGSDEWFYEYYMSQQRKLKDKDEALASCLDLWHAIQAVTQVQPMEPSTAAIIRQLQDQGFTVMALTTRSSQIAYTTQQQLNSIGIDMRKSAPTSTAFCLQSMPQVQFKRGVLFTSGQHKGRALKQFLSQTSIHPKKIVFVDDKLSNIRETATIGEEGIEFLGLRFNGNDQNTKNYNSSVASMQLKYFLNLLSDASAGISEMQPK